MRRAGWIRGSWPSTKKKKDAVSRAQHVDYEIETLLPRSVETL